MVSIKAKTDISYQAAPILDMIRFYLAYRYTAEYILRFYSDFFVKTSYSCEIHKLMMN